MDIVFYLLFAAVVAIIIYKGYKLLFEKPKVNSSSKKGGYTGGSIEVRENPEVDIQDDRPSRPDDSTLREDINELL